MARLLYRTIFDDLQSRILMGALVPGDILPSENELASKYKTSRVTIRKSLDLLKSIGLINSWHGKGYFVLEPQHNRFTLVFHENHPSFASKFQRITVLNPTDEVQSALRLRQGQKVIAIMRIMSIGSQSAAYDMKFMPYVKGMPLVETEISYADFPNLVRNKTSSFAIRTKMEIGLENAPISIAKKIEVEAGTPMLVVYRYLVDENGSSVGYGKRYLRREYGRITAFSGFTMPERAVKNG